MTAELNERDARANARRWAVRGAWLTLAGTLLSGPASLWLVNATHPQPAWRDEPTFVAHFHPIQTLPFFLGFMLMAGLVSEVTALSVLARPAARARVTLAAALAGAFAALVGFNYVVQTTFVPLLVRTHQPSSAPLLGALTMSNPDSLGWCLEMWAYAVIGVATWLVAPVFEGRGAAAGARWTFTANGPASIASALATAFLPSWALTPAGLFAFGAWNLLVVIMSVLALVALRDSAVL